MVQLSMADMEAAVAEHYAKGNPVPAEIRALNNRGKRKASRDSVLVKCVNPEAGEPVKVKHKVAPVANTVRENIAGEFKGATVEHPVRSGECPFCRTHVPLSGNGFVTAHNRGNESVAAPKTRLIERQTVPVDTGARAGDPETGEKRRAADVDGSFERGVVEIPGVDPKTGKKRMVEAPATAENLRTALEYWKGRHPRAAVSRDTQSRMIAELSRKLRAFDGAAAPRYLGEGKGYALTVSRNVPVVTYDESTDSVVETGERDRKGLRADVSPEGRAKHHGLPGAPLVRGRTTPTIAGEVTVSRVGDGPVDVAPCEDTRTGWDAKAGTMTGPLGRERLDPVVAGERSRAHYSTARTANYRKAMRRKAAKGFVPVKGALKAGVWARGLDCGHTVSSCPDMTREKAEAARDRALSAYDRQIAQATGKHRARMQRDRDSLAADYDKWITANYA